MEKMTVNELCDFFRDNPRDTWREEIEKRVRKMWVEDEITTLDGIVDEEDDGWHCNFLPEMLEPGYRFKYDIGDVVRLEEYDGYFIVLDYPALDERTTKKNIHMFIDTNGASYEVIGVSEGTVRGSDMGRKPIPWDYCIQSKMTPAENVQFDVSSS